MFKLGYIYKILVNTSLTGNILILFKEAQTINDIDGNLYQVDTIGKQTWMLENLKTTRYSNGDLIGTTTPATLDISGLSTPKYQWAYNGNESNVNTYGRLYTWYAVNDSRNVCPTGWHVPSKTELGSMTAETVRGGQRYMDGTFNYIDKTGSWWSSTQSSLSNAWYHDLGLWYVDANYTKSFGISVRCVKN